MAFMGRSISVLKNKPVLIKNMIAVGNFEHAVESRSIIKKNSGMLLQNTGQFECLKDLVPLRNGLFLPKMHGCSGSNGKALQQFSITNKYIGDENLQDDKNKTVKIKHCPSVNFGNTLEHFLLQHLTNPYAYHPAMSKLPMLDKVDPLNIVPVMEPVSIPVIEKIAARLVVIRRAKMKKHKLKKLRKKMFIEFMKIRMRREARKEKAFQNELLMQISDAEAFDAEKWAKDVLARSQHHSMLKAEKEFYSTPEGRRIQFKLRWQWKLTPPPGLEEK